jgi:hypothetical protein
MKCDVFWAIEISRTSWSNKIACYKLYEIPFQKQMLLIMLLIVFFHYWNNVTSNAFLISFKQYLDWDKCISIAQNTSHLIVTSSFLDKREGKSGSSEVNQTISPIAFLNSHSKGQQDVNAPLVPSCWQVWDKLLSCIKIEETNRLARSCSNKSDIVCT